jgi:hypothetical protein
MPPPPACQAPTPHCSNFHERCRARPQETALPGGSNRGIHSLALQGAGPRDRASAAIRSRAAPRSWATRFTPNDKAAWIPRRPTFMGDTRAHRSNGCGREWPPDARPWSATTARGTTSRRPSAPRPPGRTSATRCARRGPRSPRRLVPRSSRRRRSSRSHRRGARQRPSQRADHRISHRTRDTGPGGPVSLAQVDAERDRDAPEARSYGHSSGSTAQMQCSSTRGSS